MTREEAAKRLEEQLAKETMYWGNYFESEVDREVARLAIAALNEVGSPTTQLDENGLVPCGCGGKAQIINSSGYSRRLYVECDRCAIMLGVEATGDGALRGIYRYDDQIIKDWNHAMGMLEVE